MCDGGASLLCELAHGGSKFAGAVSELAGCKSPTSY